MYLAYITLVVVAAPIFFLAGVKLLLKYLSDKEKKQTFFFSWIFFGGTAGIALLIIEQIIMGVYFPNVVFEVPLDFLKGDPIAELARLIVSLAIACTFFSIMGGILFAAYFLPEKYRKPITVILGGLCLVYVWLYYSLPGYTWIRHPEIYEYAHSGIEELLLVGLFLIPVWFSVLLLAYGTFSIRHGEALMVRRSLLLTIGQIIVCIAYSFQIVYPTIISAIGFFVYPIWMYICFTMPEWLRKFLEK